MNEARSLNVRESRVFDHITQALDAWVENAEDDEQESTLIAYDNVGGRCYRFRFADGSTVTATLEVLCR